LIAPEAKALYLQACRGLDLPKPSHASDGAYLSRPPGNVDEFDLLLSRHPTYHESINGNFRRPSLRAYCCVRDLQSLPQNSPSLRITSPNSSCGPARDNPIPRFLGQSINSELFTELRQGGDFDNRQLSIRTMLITSDNICHIKS
jgi:hypothetical protein